MGFLLIVVLGAFSLAVIATVDWFFELATVWRAVWITGNVVMVVAFIALGSKRWIIAYTLSDTAVDAESRLSQFGQRLRTTLDYEQRSPQPAAASASLLSSLHHETLKLSEQTEWGDAVDARPLLKTLLLVVIMASSWLAALALLPEFRISAARALLLPFEYTTVSFSPANSTVRHGESVTVVATVAGRSVSSAQLQYRPVGAEADWIILDLVPADVPKSNGVEESSEAPQLHGELSAVLSDLTQDIEFEVLAGPRSLPEGSVRVLQPLTLEKFEARIAPPAYTGRSEESLTTLDLKVLEGARVDLKLEFNRPAVEVNLKRQERVPDSQPTDSDAAANGSVKAGIDSDSAGIPLVFHENAAMGTLADLRQNVSLTLSAKTEDGMSLDPQQINIRVQPDLMARVQFIAPPEELIVTATTEVPMIVEAGDELGLHKVGIMFQIGSGPFQTLHEEDAGGSTDVFRLTSLMMLEEHQLTIQDAVTYYAYAEDNYFGQPRRTVTPLRFIDIRPYKMDFQVVESKGGGGGESSDGSSVTLEELISRQRQALSRSFQSVQKSSQHPVAGETISQLTEEQTGIKDATLEFSAGMAERGAELPSLDEAIQHMDTALDSLNDQDLTSTAAAEQLAVTELIRARENLRTMLKQCNSPSASAQRKFDRQMRQKLRMPKKDPSDQQEQVAQIRKKLEDLAKREREWSKQAQQCCNSSASSSGKPSQSQSSQSQSSQQAQSPQDSGQKASEQKASEQKDSEQQKSESSSDQDGASPTPAEVAEAQEKLQAELAEVQKQLEQLNAAGQAARDQAQQAAESMKQGLAELKQNDGDAAGAEGQRSADQLEQLSDHLTAKNAQDFGQRLDDAQKVAQQLASQQQQLEQQLRNEFASGPTEKPAGSKGPGDGDGSQKAASGKALARDQQAVATQTKMLAEVLDGLERDAAKEAGGVQQRLQQAQAENPARDIAAGMNQTAEDLKAQRTTAAGRGAAEALQRLQELSQSLSAARGEFAQPQLKELLALEEQLAQFQEQLKRAQNKGDDSAAAAGQKWQQLEARLDKLATVDQRLAEAMRQLRQGSPQKPETIAESAGQPTPEEFFLRLQLGDFSGMREVSKALQTKIQEAILAGSLMDADQPVPPAYKELVEKYYRALSDDLR
jgi:hypothetical protein